MPCSKSVSCGRSLSRSDTLPNSVSLPVRITSALALPLTTWVPIHSALVRWPSGVSADKHRDRFLYRVGFTRQGCFIDKKIFGFLHQTVSGDDISGVQNDDISGDNLFDGNFLGPPSRSTVALICTMASNFSTALVALCSCQNPSRPLTRTMVRIMRALTGSCKKNDNPVANKRMRISGLLN